MVEITVGGVVAGTVLNVQTTLLAKELPDKSLAAVVIVAVYKVSTASNDAGVKVAILPVQLVVPNTATAPGPLKVKAVAGDVKVVQFIGTLKVALRT